MEATMHAHEHHHHEMPASGRALTGVAISATLHCLTGCALGEIAGMAIGTAFGFSNLGTILLAIALAFVFGYSLTSLPLLRAGFTLAAVIPIAFASDTLSVATMEVIDNLVVVVIPGAMDAGLGDLLFWGSLAFALVVAGAFAVPVNRALIARGKGHVAVHETGIHGGPPVRLVAAVAAVGFVFGTAVLVAEAVSSDGMDGGGGGMSADAVRGLAVSSGGMTLVLDRTELPRGRPAELSFRITGTDGRAVRDFEVEHTKRMHFIVARRDLTGFQHLHPAMGADGTWHVPLKLAEAGSYRVFADFKRGGENETLAADVAVNGRLDSLPLPAASDTARTSDGYDVELAGRSSAGRESALDFSVTRGGRPVAVEPYLGAGGHLVALREGDLAYLHVHPAGHGAPAGGGPIEFATEFPTAGRYRLFLQFRDAGRVHTAAFTRTVAPGAGGDGNGGGMGGGGMEH
jgi:hypothetical protein